MYEDPELILVIWRDSYGVSADWVPVKDINSPALECLSVGWLIHENEQCVTILPHMSQPAHDHAEWQGCGDMTIPRSALISMHRLEKGGEMPKTAPAT